MPLKIDHWHPFAELFPLMAGDEWDSFCASIRRSRGNREPVIYRRLKDGRLQGIDGRNRYQACEETATKCRMEEEILETEEEVRQYILDRNIHRRHLTRELRQKLVADLSSTGQSTRQIASVLGISHQTVHRDLKGPSVTNVTASTATSPANSTVPSMCSPLPSTTPKPGETILPELRLKVMPRRWPELEALTTVQQTALLARLREAMSFDRALAEVRGIGATVTPAPRATQLVFDWGRYDAAYSVIEDQVDLLARIAPAAAAAKLGRLLAEFGALVKELAERD